MFAKLVWVCLTHDKRVEKSNYYIPAEPKTDAKVPGPMADHFLPHAGDVIHPVLGLVKGLLRD